MTSPSAVNETTLGTSLSPSAPTITSGFARFIQATRLLVVPRSMPTTALLSNSIWNIRLHYEIRYVFPPVQQSAYRRERFAIAIRVPLPELLLQFGINFAAHSLKLRPEGLERLSLSRVLDRHVEFEDLLEQLRRNILCCLVSDIEAFKFQQILSPLDGIAESPVGVIQKGRRF